MQIRHQQCSVLRRSSPEVFPKMCPGCMVQVVPCIALYFAVPCTFMRFIEAKEESCPRNFDANGKVELTNEMIRQAGARFGVDLKDAQDLLAMHKTMTRHAFADWVNACRLHSDRAKCPSQRHV
jgi:hypothetical protein